MKSLNRKLRNLFNKFKLYTVEDLVNITGFSKEQVQSQISRMKNPNHCGVYFEPLDLVQDIGYQDRIKRWGLRGAKDIYKPRKNHGNARIESPENKDEL